MSKPLTAEERHNFQIEPPGYPQIDTAFRNVVKRYEATISTLSDDLDARIAAAVAAERANPVWVICIEYDYGVWDEAGFFGTQDDAERWISNENDRERREWLSEEGDYVGPAFYACKLSRTILKEQNE